MESNQKNEHYHFFDLVVFFLSSRPEPQPAQGADSRHRPFPLHAPHRRGPGSLPRNHPQLLQSGARGLHFLLRLRAHAGEARRGDDLNMWPRPVSQFDRAHFFLIVRDSQSGSLKSKANLPQGNRRK